MPRPAVVPVAATSRVGPPSSIRAGPSKWLGSGRTRVASVPVTSTNPSRSCGDSKLKTAVAEPPPANSSSAETWVGTVTSNSVPARGPEPIVRRSREREPTALTRRTGPRAATRAVR